jgi:hypothetical protein
MAWHKKKAWKTFIVILLGFDLIGIFFFRNSFPILAHQLWLIITGIVSGVVTILQFLGFTENNKLKQGPKSLYNILNNWYLQVLFLVFSCAWLLLLKDPSCIKPKEGYLMIRAVNTKGGEVVSKVDIKSPKDSSFNKNNLDLPTTVAVPSDITELQIEVIPKDTIVYRKYVKPYIIKEPYSVWKDTENIVVEFLTHTTHFDVKPVGSSIIFLHGVNDTIKDGDTRWLTAGVYSVKPYSNDCYVIPEVITIPQGNDTVKVNVKQVPPDMVEKEIRVSSSVTFGDLESVRITIMQGNNIKWEGLIDNPLTLPVGVYTIKVKAKLRTNFSPVPDNCEGIKTNVSWRKDTPKIISIQITCGG